MLKESKFQVDPEMTVIQIFAEFINFIFDKSVIVYAASPQQIIKQAEVTARRIGRCEGYINDS